MKTLTIEIPEPGDERGMFDVVDHQGRRCDGLSWDEMLGQVAMLTMPPAAWATASPCTRPTSGPHSAMHATSVCRPCALLR